MNPLVVDSSVAFKWLCPRDEEGVEAASRLLDEHEAGTMVLTAPSTLHVELANALRNSRFMDPDTVLALVERLSAFRVELCETTDARIGLATALSYRHGISVYDALFLALAQELGCPLVTADRKAFAGIDTRVEILLL
jgi:predicted nucleic acid-binding protein